MKKRTGLALLAFTAVLLTACGKEEQLSEKQQALKQKGMELQAEGDYEGALEKYEEALALADMQVGKEEIDIACYKASAQAKSGDLTGAIQTYSAILALTKDTTGELHLGRGLLYAKAGDASMAEEDLTEALAATKDALLQGIIYQALEEPQKAKKALEEAEKEGEAEALFLLAGIYEAEDDHDYARSLLEKYLSGGETSAEGCLAVAQAYLEECSYQDALTAIHMGLEKENAVVRKSLLQAEVACYEQLGDYTAAKEKAEAYLEEYPEDELIQREYEFLKSR